MTYALFLGCLIPSRLPYLEKSIKVLLDKLGVEYVEPEEFSCCCDPIIGKSLSLDTWIAVAARNLAVAEKENLNILTACNGCFSTLNEANHMLRHDQALKGSVNAVLKEVGREYGGKAEVVPLVKLLRDTGKEKIAGLVTNGLDLKVAPHYGCHLILPEKVTGIDKARNPTIMETLSEWVGAKPMHYSATQKCCGSGLESVEKETSSDMLGEILAEMRASGATHILTPCPFCFVQFDQGQAKEEKKLPVLYISELYDLAFGSSAEEIGLKYHRVPVAI